MRESERGFPQGAEDDKPVVQVAFEQISASGETQTGGVPLTQLPDGRHQAIYTYVMFSTSTYTPLTPGTSNVTIGANTYYLWTEENTNDGTLRNITRTYQTAGTVEQIDESLNGGALLKRTIKSFHTVPATPSGYTLVYTGDDNPNGYDVYTYTFYSANPSIGAGGEISRRYVDSQGGTTAFDESNPDGGAGAVRCIITYLTPTSVTTDPTTGPTSFVKIAVDYDTKDGYKIWTVQYGYGSGLITDESTISASGALITYHRVQFGSAPSAPSATIGGTVTLFQSETNNSDGYVVYSRRWAEGNGQASITTQGQSDGALVYTVTDYDVSATTPAYPGGMDSTHSLIQLTQKPENGYYVNTAVYKKWPASQARRQTIQWNKPGLCSFSGTVLTVTPDSERVLLATETVSYSTTQTTTTPFEFEYFCSFIETYTPTATGIPVTNQYALRRTIGPADSVSGTNANYKGVLCDSYSAVVTSSNPTSLPSGSTTLRVDNEPYLVDVTGTLVYKTAVTTYSF